MDTYDVLARFVLLMRETEQGTEEWCAAVEQATLDAEGLLALRGAQAVRDSHSTWFA